MVTREWQQKYCHNSSWNWETIKFLSSLSFCYACVTGKHFYWCHISGGVNTAWLWSVHQIARPDSSETDKNPEITSYPMLIAHCSPFFLSLSHPDLTLMTLITPRLHQHYSPHPLHPPPNTPSPFPYFLFVKNSLFITHRPKQRSSPLGGTHRFCKWYGCWLLIALAQRVIEVLLYNLWSVQKKMTSVTNPISRLSISECVRARAVSCATQRDSH